MLSQILSLQGALGGGTAVVDPPVVETLLAFPTALGAGANVTGGRDATQIIHVTTLVWDAVGGLKEAIQTSGARTIVFDISGEIDATSQGNFSTIIDGAEFNDITIAGQSAPDGGITIKTSFFRFGYVDNVIIRYIRFRNTDTFVSSDSMWLYSGSGVILDHCTFSHGNDEAADLSTSLGTMENITVQNCFFQDSKTGIILGADTGGADLGNFTFVNNLFSNISHRFPNPQGNGQYDIINNVVYNWKERLVRVTNGGTYNIINNYYKRAADGLGQPGWFGTNGDLTIRSHKAQLQTTDNPLIYTTGSIVTGSRETPQVDDSDMWQVFAGSNESIALIGDPVPAQYFTDTQFPLVGESYTIKTAEQSYIDVLADTGANKTLNSDGTINTYQDTKDVADILMIQNDTFVSADAGFTYPALSTIPYPVIPENTRPVEYYVSNAHIPEAYLIANGLPQTAGVHLTKNATGYTYLEVFMNEVDGDYVAPAIVDVTSVSILPATASIEAGSTQQLTETVLPIDATDKTGTWSSNSANATVSNGLVTAVTEGSATITFTTTDGSFTDSSIITITAAVDTGELYIENSAVSVPNETNSVGSWTVNASGTIAVLAENEGDSTLSLDIISPPGFLGANLTNFTLTNGVSYDIEVRVLGETTSCYWWLKLGATTDPFSYIAAADTWQTFTATVIGDGGAFDLEIASGSGVNNYVRVAYLSIKETV